MAGSITRAYNWAVQTCNASNVGYSQSYRCGQTVGGVTYYDCSSFISAALTEAGFTSSNPWFTTYTMGTYLKQWGFTHYSAASTTWKAGDVLVRDDNDFKSPYNYAHTEMVYDADKGYTMGAHSANHTLADQVSINSYDGHGVWTDLWRVGAGGATLEDWTPAGHPYANASGMTWYEDIGTGGYEIGSEAATNNAKLVMYFLYNIGWSRQAIYAILGNMQAECGLNPAASEYLGSGFGLVQWTPSSSGATNPLITNLKTIYGTSWGAYDYTDGTCQMNALIAEYMQANYEQKHYEFSKNTGVGRQWYNADGSSSLNYGFTVPKVDWYNWATDSSTALDVKVKQFMVSYERPTTSASGNHWDKRVSFAQQWSSLLANYTPPTTIGASAGRRMPVWMMMRPVRKMRRRR